MNWLAAQEAVAQKSTTAAPGATPPPVDASPKTTPSADTLASDAAATGGADAPAPGAADTADTAVSDTDDGEPAPLSADARATRAVATGLAVVASLFVVSMLLARYFSNAFRMEDKSLRMFFVFFAVLTSSVTTYMGWPPKLGIDLRGGVILVYEVLKGESGDAVDVDMDKLVAAITKRVNPGGIKEVTVRPYGENEIEIIIPEADQSELAKIQEIISTTGQLEFRIVANNRDHAQQMALANDPKYSKLREIAEVNDEGQREVIAKWVPVIAEEASQFQGNPKYATRINKRGQTEALVMIDPFNVTGDYLTSASPGIDRRGRPCVNFMFNSTGSKLFGRLTGANLPDQAQEFERELAIVLDGELQSAPAIRDTIFDRGEITGTFTEERVQTLAGVLTAGSLPATINKTPTSSLLTGPTLGADTIKKGINSMLVSTVAVVIFMIVYYRFAGLVANMALLLNVLLIVAFMILFNAAFTLSGLAGLALTVGMAVDANVLIYERMREELARGATLRMAIRNGFDRATTTIVDANVTTLISAIVLYAIGTDQVKGFAVTLILGIVMNLFTAIAFTRLVFDVAEKRRWIRELKMLRVLDNPNFDFIGKRRLAITFSLILIAGGLAAVFMRGKGLLDIDFTGGVSVETLFEKPQEIAFVRKQVRDLPDVTVQDVKISNEPAGKRFLIVTSEPDIDKVESRLKEIFSAAGNELAFNHLTASNAEPIAGEPPQAEAPADKQPPAAGSKPASREGAGLRVGDENLLAWAEDVATLLAQNEPATDAAPPASGPARGPAAPPPSEDDQPTGEAPDEADADRSAPPGADATGAGGPRPAADANPFAGGAKVTLKFSQPIGRDGLASELDDILRERPEGEPPYDLDNRDYDPGSDRAFDEWTLQIALPPAETEALVEQVKQALADKPFFPSSNKIGASVAGNTQWSATNALLASLLLIVLYVWIRFQQVSFGFAAVLALVHDVLVALGALAVSYWVAPYLGFALVEPFKINLPIVAAFLTIIGYSINDTIVIFDRIREIRGKSPELSAELVNLCLNQTLSRTLLTSLTVFIVVLILYIFGGQGIHGFAFTLVVGTISGTYSTVYIATPVLIWLNRRSEKTKSNQPVGAA